MKFSALPLFAAMLTMRNVCTAFSPCCHPEEVESSHRELSRGRIWSGTGPYPSVTVRLDFRGADVVDFVYHCHILEHEDGGMMAIVRVFPR